MMKQVLIVEDDEAIRRTLVTLMEYEGYAHLVASNGEEALKILAERHEEIGIIVTDVAMPVMDGVEMLRRIAGTPEFDRIPKVVCSASLNAAQTVYLNERKIPQIHKPFNIDDLISTIEAISE